MDLFAQPQWRQAPEFPGTFQDFPERSGTLPEPPGTPGTWNCSGTFDLLTPWSPNFSEPAPGTGTHRSWAEDPFSLFWKNQAMKSSPRVSRHHLLHSQRVAMQSSTSRSSLIRCWARLAQSVELMLIPRTRFHIVTQLLSFRAFGSLHTKERVDFGSALGLRQLETCV